MLQQDEPDDYVVATGETHSVREFLEAAFGRLGLDWQRYVEIDPRLLPARRGRRAHRRLGKARRHLGLGAEDTLRRPGAGDGGRRPATPRGRADGPTRPGGPVRIARRRHPDPSRPRRRDRSLHLRPADRHGRRPLPRPAGERPAWHPRPSGGPGARRSVGWTEVAAATAFGQPPPANCYAAGHRRGSATRSPSAGRSTWSGNAPSRRQRGSDVTLYPFHSAPIGPSPSVVVVHDLRHLQPPSTPPASRR